MQADGGEPREEAGTGPEAERGFTLLRQRLQEYCYCVDSQRKNC